MSIPSVLHDKDIREPLFDFLEETFGKVRILEEKQIARVRSDIVMITPALLYGIEIKSDADTYVRLSNKDPGLQFRPDYPAELEKLALMFRRMAEKRSMAKGPTTSTSIRWQSRPGPAFPRSGS